MFLGVLSQYAGDIISNIISGRRGKNAFKLFTGEITLKKLEMDMKRTAKRMLISTGAFEFFTNSIFSALSRKF